MQQNVLEAHRVGKGLSRADLASRVGVSIPTIFRWETHQMAISWESLLKLAQVLELKPIDIIPALAGTPDLQTEEPTHA